MSSCYAEKEDIELIRAWRDGDEDAFTALLSRYKQMVRAVARRYFLAGADDEDLVQEGTIGFYKSILSYDESKLVKFSTFAELCTERQIMSAVKLAGRKKHKPLNEYISTSTEDAGAENSSSFEERCVDNDEISDPEEIILKRENESLLRAEVSKRLSSFENTVFELFISGMTYQEMSDTTGRPEKAIDNAMQRIKKKLKDIKQ